MVMRFRLLRSWKVTLIEDAEGYAADGDAGVFMPDVGKGREADVFCLSRSEKEVESSLFHECLHICLKELSYHGGARRKAAEELLVHDLEDFVYGRDDVPEEESEEVSRIMEEMRKERAQWGTDEWVEEFISMSGGDE